MSFNPQTQRDGPMFEWPGQMIEDPMGMMFDMQRGLWIPEHFIGYGPDGNNAPMSGWRESVSGAGVSNVNGGSTPPAGAYGTALCSIPAQAEGGTDSGGVNLYPEFVQANDLVGMLCMICRICVDVIPDAANDSQIILGIGDTEADFNEPSDGWYLYYDKSPGATWQVKSARASVRTSEDTGFAAVAGAWQTLAIIVDEEEGTVQAWGANDGDMLDQLATVTPADIQPAVEVTGLMGISGIASIRAAAQSMWIDYVGVGAKYGVFR